MRVTAIDVFGDFDAFDIFIDTRGHFYGCDDGDEVVVVDDCGSYHFIIKP